MKVLITGVAGFVGFHLAKRLLAKGVEVVGLDNVNAYYSPQLKEARLALLKPHSGFRFERMDLADGPAMAALFEKEKFPVVVHLGAQAGVRYSLTHPESYGPSNLTGFVHVLEGCRRHEVGHLVYASSSSVYGLNARMPFRVEDNVDHPVSLYAATKKSNELLAHAYSHLYRIPATGLRFFTVYGPWGRPDMAYFSFTKAILEGKPISLFNHGNMLRDFTYIDDVVEAIVRVMAKPAQADPAWSPGAPVPGRSSAPNRIYNLGNQDPVKLLTFVETLEKILGKKAAKELLPMQPGDVMATGADMEPMRKDFGFAPTTPLEKGLTQFAAWYRDNLDLCKTC